MAKNGTSNGHDPIVIVDGARTPVGSFQGSLKDAKATELGSAAIKGALVRAGVKPEEVDEVIMGCVLPAGLGQAPNNRLCHVVSNTIVEHEDANGDVIVRSRFHCAEYLRYEVRQFTGKYRHYLKKTDDGYRIALQRVDLVNREGRFATTAIVRIRLK